MTFKIKDYDLVGPVDFHEDDELDPLRDNLGLPWLQVKIVFQAEMLDTPQKMDVQLIFPLEKRHLPINKNKGEFRDIKPTAHHI